MSKSGTQRIAKKQPDLLLFDGHDCVSALKALGEDNRVRIIGLLMDSPLGVCEIARRLGSTSKNMGGSACMWYRKESGEVARTLACWILAVAASGSINDRHSP
jgi:DNA-binding transcriptional ArsR family regulator